ncbi:UNVERIFIED_CONTAM: hypothetical protein FKN15_046803 [Acipenser sinensis]
MIMDDCFSSIAQLDGLLPSGDKKALPDRSREIRERLRGKGLPSGRSTTPNAMEKYKARFHEQASLNRGLSKSMGFLAIGNKLREEEDCPPCTSSDYNSGHEDMVDESHQQGGKLDRMDKRPLYHNGDYGYSRKHWASSMDLDYPDPAVVRHAGMDDRVTVRPKSASRAKEARHSDYGEVTGTLGAWKAHHLSELSVCSALSNAYDRIKDRQKKLHMLREAMDVDDPLKVHRRYHSDAYSTSSESPSVISSDPDYRQVRRREDNRRYSSQAVLADHDVVSLASHVSLRHRQYELPSEENLVSQEMMLKRQEQEMQRLQAQMAHRQFKLSLYPGDLPRASMLDVTRDPLRDIALETTLTQRKLKVVVVLHINPKVKKVVPTKKGKGEDLRRKVNILLLSGQRLELTCDTKSICKDVFDMVVAQIGLVEHHLFGLAYLKENEFFFVDPDLKLSKVAPEGWKDDPKKKKTVVNFNLFFRIKFFVDDVNLIQHTLTKHQYYLQLRRDILEERMRCDEETTLLLASLALQAEFGDYQPEVHGKAYFRLEHYLATTVLEKVDQSFIKEELPKLHSTYFGASEKETEFEFLKVCQKLPEYGVHFHRVLPEKKSQTGIMLGVCSKGVLIFEMHNGARTPVLRFPWRETKKISFTVCQKLPEYGVHFHRVLPEKKSQTGIMLGVCSKGVLIFEMHNGARTPVLRFPWRETKKISFTKKKISLQNTSDEIKHLFQTDSSKTCQYLLHLSSAQHKFYLQMKTRQNNQELQDIESSSLSHLKNHSGSAGVLPMGRAMSTVSLATSNISRPFDQPHPTQAENLKRTYCSELSLNKLLPGRPQSTVEPTNPRVMMSKSYHDLSQVPESPEGRVPPYNSQSQSSLNRIHLAASMEGVRTLPSHHRARSDTESITVAGKPNNVFSSKTLADSRRSPGKRQLGCDSSSFEDTGQAYVIGYPHGEDSSESEAPMKNPDEDEITWGSNELPIETLKQDPTEDGPLITEEELTSLPLVRVVPEGCFTGSKLKGVIRMLRGLLDQKIPLEEFENLQNLQPLDECLIGQTKENRKKNRYKNILPYDATRVCLGNHGGYINASFIKMPVKDEEFVYVACQGPLPNTLADFWQMVWEQKSNVIAMMTQEVEGGKVKCQRYWPDTPRTAAMVDDRLQLTLLKHQHLGNFILRLIEVKDVQTYEIQHVTHLNFTGWPDHGTPSEPEQLLTFISYMRHIHQSGPIITHCSAGIGRSGTLICIDVVLGLISKDVDVSTACRQYLTTGK